MTVEDIYTQWPFKVRFLRRELWDQLKKQIVLHQITSVLEFGSGISTILFNNFGLDAVSYDTNPVYQLIVKRFNLANVEFRIWNNVSADIEGYFGLALVDGILPRANQFSYALKHARYVAIDDFTDEESSQELIPLTEGCLRIDSGNTRLAIFRRV
jgi:hypothetical protein